MQTSSREKAECMIEKKYKKSLFLFRRDLRCDDNTGLRHALEDSEKVICAFNFDSIQVGPKNSYRSENAIQFMIESLQDLEAQLKKRDGRLYLFHGDTEKIVATIIKKERIDALYLNFDYTPFSKKRDKTLEALCKKEHVSFYGFHDLLLIGDPDSIVTGSKTPYGVYTPFYRKAHEKGAMEPIKLLSKHFYTQAISHAETSALYKKILKKKNDDIKVYGGRQEALKIYKTLKSDQKNYNKDRDFPALDATTHLSAYHKFGCISIRESYYAMKKALGAQTQLLKELYWRDFYTYVAHHNPKVFGHAYQEKYDSLEWSYSKKNFHTWCNGKTGFPIVDAGMRQLNSTGWMHNRVRMIVASFLTKDLLINWQWGEKYFAQQLVDYDPCVNNGSWQWAASTGCDAQPYFRIFNPWIQQKKFDPQCTYIKQWVPELKNTDNKIIHAWNKYSQKIAIKGYPAPIVEHDEQRTKALKMYKRAR